jgi:hypothetical protein
MERQGFGLLVNHWQTNAPGLGLVQQFTVLFPPMQGGQWIEFPFDGPVSTNDHIGAPHQPNAHDLLQHVAAKLPIGQVQALFQQVLAKRFFVHGFVRGP